MKRRKFLRSAAAAGVAVPAMVNGIPLQAHSNNQWLQSMLNPSVETDHVMVLIFLNGGNDGINTVIPIDQYGRLVNAREKVVLPENSILKLNGVANTGLHPSMTGLQTLYNEGKLNIVQNVGYPNPNFSHFRATDIWTSASDAEKYIDTGWVGRYLNEEFPGYPLDYPNAANPDPLAVQVGGNLPLLFLGPNAQMAMNLSNPDIFGAWPARIDDPAPNSPLGKELTYIRTIARQSKSYADALVAGFLRGTNVGTYPAGNYLGDILKLIARLIKGGLKSRLYLVELGGFDTHADQVVATDKKTGAHANLLKLLSDAIFAFQRDLEAMQLDKRVLGMTFSEFGRRVKGNDSNGTDHGAAAPLFMFGTKVQSGIIGANPTIPQNATFDDNLPMQHDFRSVYASVLKDWFCLKQETVDKILFKNFQTLPLIKNECTTTSIDEYQNLDAQLTVVASPNPMVERTQLSIHLPNSGFTTVHLIDPLGRTVKNIFTGKVESGHHQLSLQNENYPPGNYYIRVQNSNNQKTEPLVIVQ
ncbi:MAG: DUF1501 domain-containing protein [Saprospiraceae bacterium]|nr:DUF1501 domain-containing protein [Saprospiraceae bacterium]MBK7812687.1 DUF1501 domain-containing protein [Saprospiraceae bacterium]MBK9630878.1 DUF1501 domain-containing protein [Saprospiraceae bacterium]